MTMWKSEQAQRFASLPPLADYAYAMTTHYYTDRATKAGVSTKTFLSENVVGGCKYIH